MENIFYDFEKTENSFGALLYNGNDHETKSTISASKIFNNLDKGDKREVFVETDKKNKYLANLVNCQISDTFQNVSEGGISEAVFHDTSEPQLELSDPPDISQILSLNESSIKATAHNVSILNAACQKVLKEMEYILVNSLKKNRKEQEIIFNYLNSNEKSKTFEGSKKNNLKCLGIPYFKDANGYPPPLNEDVLHKKKYNKLLPMDFLKNCHVWSSKDSNLLTQAVSQSSKKESEQEGNNCRTIDWLKISATNLDGKYSPFECKSMWLMNLNPQVNKSSWSAKEMKQLKALAEKYKHQNWDKIAEELNTQRTGFQCCVQYHSHKPPCGEKWTKKEDEALLQLIKQFKVKDHIPWKKVVWNFEGRSLRQCQERYIYHLQNIKKGSFTMEEDYVLLYLYSKFKSFKEVAKYFPKRVPPQIRARYEYLVKSTMPKFSKEEDELLMQLMIKYPRNWEKISEFFQDRSKLQCRGRWAALQKQISLKNDVSSESDEEEEVMDSINNSDKSKIKDEIDAKLINKKFIQGSPKKGSKRGRETKSCKKFSEQYMRLLEYCKCGYKFLYGPKPRLFSLPEEKEKICSKMEIIMRNLSVNYAEILKKFDLKRVLQNCEFDTEDTTILENLKIFVENKSENNYFGSGHQIFPPNYMTLLGLRTLILGTNNIINSVNYYKTTANTKGQQFNTETRVLFSDAKKLFKSRLKALFAFPIMLSTISQDGTEVIHLPPKKTKRVRPMSQRARKIHCKKIQALRKRMKSSFKKELQDSAQINQSDFHLANLNTTENKSDVFLVKRKRGRPRKSLTEGNENELEAKKSKLNGS